MKRHAMGWLPDPADFRDHTAADSGVARRLESASFPKGATALPKRIDLHPWCSPIEDQGELLAISRLFLYRVTRRLMGGKAVLVRVRH